MTLLPCPFCGSKYVEAYLLFDENLYQRVVKAHCQSCLAESHTYPTVEKAIAAWNTRNHPELDSTRVKSVTPGKDVSGADTVYVVTECGKLLKHTLNSGWLDITPL